MDIYEELVKLKTSGGEGVLVTVVEKEGHGPATSGFKMLVLKDGTRTGTVGGGALEFSAVKHAAEILETKTNRLIHYLLSRDNEIIDEKLEKTGMLCGGKASLFFEYMGSGLKLYIFGAGHIGQALAYHFNGLNYYITLIDCREGMVNTIPNVQARITHEYHNVFNEITVPPHSYFIIAAHTHELDYVILKHIYESNLEPSYIGMVASKRKAPAMVEQLKSELGNNIDLTKLYSPVGLDVGGATPHEIAISIIAELQAIQYGKNENKHLRKEFL